jgi:hypothetical protein
MEYTKTTAKIDGEGVPVPCYTAGETWNGWDVIYLTAETLEEWTSKWDKNPVCRFFEARDGTPIARVYEDVLEGESIEFEGETITVYPMDGYCFILNGRES